MINNSPANLTINGVAESITNGTISIQGGTLTDSTGITIGSSATLTGLGTVSGAVSNTGGTIAVTGGNMTANSGITNTAAITIATTDTLSSNSGEINNNSGGSISITGTGEVSYTGGGSGVGINNNGGDDHDRRRHSRSERHGWDIQLDGEARRRWRVKSTRAPQRRSAASAP